VTIGSGGAGWRTHPTFPYLTNNITLNFVGGGATRPAFGYATVSGVGGTIISTTILEQGAGYTSVPSVIALGGYADIALLVQSSINRRNPNCLTRSFGIYLTQVNRCVISNCNFINLKSTAIQLLGCKDAIVEDCTFTGCGANDGDHIDVFITDYDSGGSTYVYGENCIVRRNQSRGDKRCFCFITQGKGGEFYGNNTEGAGMCSGGPGTNAASSSGQYWLTIRDNVAFNCPTSDFSASFCEITATRNIAFIDNVFNNCDGAMISAPGSRNMRFVRNSYFASQQATAQPVGYGPSSESFEFGVGQNPQIGFLRNPATNGAVTLGELNSEPMQDVICEDEIIYDDRGIDGPAMYHFFSSGTPSGQSGNIIIRNPRRSNYAATGLDSTTPITYVPAPTIFDSRFSIWVSGGAIDPSQGGQRIVHTFTAGTTGLVTISGVGFPAKRVNIWATSDASTDGRLFVGSLCWNLEVTNGGRIGGLASCFQTGVGQYAQNIDDAIQLIDAAGNNSFDTRFSSWTMDGFVLNVAFAPITCKMIFQCFAT
jgi:hypothetical protein